MIPWKWPSIMFVLAACMATWAFVWQYYLLDAFIQDPSPSVTVIADSAGNRRVLWASTAAGSVVASLGVIFLGLAARFKRQSPACGRIAVVFGVALVVLGFSCLVLFASARSVVIDERERVVVLERQWLYVRNHDTLAFDDIARVNLRIRRTRAGGEAGGCLIAQGLSIIRNDRTWVEVPFRQEEIGRTVARIVGVPQEGTEKREC